MSGFNAELVALNQEQASFVSPLLNRSNCHQDPILDRQESYRKKPINWIFLGKAATILLFVTSIVYLTSSTALEVQSLKSNVTKEREDLKSLLKSALLTVKAKIIQNRNSVSSFIANSTNDASKLREAKENVERNLNESTRDIRSDLAHLNYTMNSHLQQLHFHYNILAMNVSQTSIMNKDHFKNIDVVLDDLQRNYTKLRSKLEAVEAENRSGNLSERIDQLTEKMEKNEKLITDESMRNKANTDEMSSYLRQTVMNVMETQEDQLMRSSAQSIVDHITDLLAKNFTNMHEKMMNLTKQINFTQEGIETLKPLIRSLQAMQENVAKLQNTTNHYEDKYDLENMIKQQVANFVEDLVNKKANEKSKSLGYVPVPPVGFLYFPASGVKAAFMTAKRTCKAKQGHLLDLGNLSKDDYLEALDAIRVKIAGRFKTFLVGLYQPVDESQWHWDYSLYSLDPALDAWKPGQPSNTRNKEDCALIHLDSLKLNDIECQAPVPYICQFDDI